MGKRSTSIRYRRYIDPEDWEMTMMILMTEFDGNESLNIATDQNP